MAVQQDPETFKDNQGQEWRPKLTTPVLIEASRELDLALSKILAFDLRLHELFDFIWFTCKHQAASRTLSKDDFFERVGMREAATALRVISHHIEKAFPELKGAFTEGMAGAMGGASRKGPLDVPGPSTTSSHSAPTPE